MRNFLKKLLGSDRSPRPAADPAEEGAFAPQNALEALLVAAAADPARRPEFERALLAANLYAATPDAPPEGSRTFEAGDDLPLLTVAGRDGEPVAALFSSEGRIVEAFGEGTGYIMAPGADLLELVSVTGATLNPGSACGVQWTADDLAALLGKPVRWTVQEPTTVMLAVPSEPPEALIETIRASLEGNPAVSEAWFALAHWPATDERSWHLDVRTSLDPDSVGGLLADAFRTAALGGQRLNMVVRPPGGDQGLGIRLIPSSTH